MTCAFAGLDLGYQFDRVGELDFCIKGDTGGGCDSEMETTAFDFLMVPRFGIEIGKRVKFRLTMDAPIATRLDMEERTKGVLVMAGVGYSW